MSQLLRKIQRNAWTLKEECKVKNNNKIVILLGVQEEDGDSGQYWVPHFPHV